MPRSERPLEFDDSALSRFATDLRKLRAAAGSPPYRELARRAHYSSTTLSDAAGGRRLPSLEVTLAYVRACGADVEVWERRWRALAGELNNSAAPAADTVPYVGLRAHDSEDAERFFGRERLIEDLLQRVGTHKLVAVVGSSGSGKSSLLRAGLAPRLAGPVLFLTPDGHPLEECVNQVRRALPATVIIVDHFERLFTANSDDLERTRFVTALIAAVEAEGNCCRLVLGLRADAWSQCARIPELAAALNEGRVDVGPMSPDELRRAIAYPAINVRCTVESGLLATLVASTHNQAGALPWLSQALLATWQRRKGITLTLPAFEAWGGIEGALAKSAEAVFLALDQQRQSMTRYVFLRMSEPVTDSQPTARTVKVHDLNDAPGVADVIEHFTAARLLVRDKDTLTLAHTALATAWPRLVSWMAEDRETRWHHRELADATALWERHDHDPSTLLRGTRLAVLQDWADCSWYPNTRERAFLAASRTAEKREHDAHRRATRQQRHLVAAVTAALVIALAALAHPGGTACPIEPAALTTAAGQLPS
ncbi:helix-turn-helix domain-containing protein [Amycolatopsis sp. TRM77291]